MIAVLVTSRVDRIRQRHLRALAVRSALFSALPTDDDEMVLHVAELLKYAGAVDGFWGDPVARMRALVQRLGVRYEPVYGVHGGLPPL